MTAAVSLAGVGKRYVKYDDVPTLVGHAFRLGRRSRRSRLWALRGVDLEVAPGQSVGVIGRNGSGKSTLLRLLAGVTAPTEGRVAVRGRVAPLLSLGVGFHAELTGRENAYVNGAILGLSARQVAERLDEVVAFAELAAFVDTPVKFYSSGMFVRLGFAVSVVSEPEVLLVDEVLAVGDVGFQRKCFERMRELQRAGTTIVVVSHDLQAVRELCPRTVVLHDGAVRHDGDTPAGIALYHELLGQRQAVDPSGRPVDVLADPPVVVDAFGLVGADGQAVASAAAGDEVVLRLLARVVRPVERAVVEVGIFGETGVRLHGDTAAVDLAPGAPVVVEAPLRLALASGSYAAYAWVRTPDGELLADPPSPAAFYVAGRPGLSGVADLGGPLTLRRPRAGEETPAGRG